MVSWLTAGDTSVTRGGIIVLRGGACAVERAADPVCWMLDNGKASAALFQLVKIRRASDVRWGMSKAGFFVKTTRSSVVKTAQLARAERFPIRNRPSVTGKFRSSPVSFVKSSAVMQTTSSASKSFSAEVRSSRVSGLIRCISLPHTSLPATCKR
jgi:hypothetical protein